jgi:diadenosine tetraphosphate (Ap4A) HIT family hydrolase
VSIGLKEILDCEKTYVMQFAEGDGHHHVHLHVVPRSAEMPLENRGPNIFNYMQPENEVPESARNEIGAAMREFLKEELK